MHAYMYNVVDRHCRRIRVAGFWFRVGVDIYIYTEYLTSPQSGLFAQNRWLLAFGFREGEIACRRDRNAWAFGAGGGFYVFAAWI